MLLQCIREMLQKLDDLAEDMQFKQNIMVAKKHMRRVDTPPLLIKQWEANVRNKRFKKKHPKQWAAHRREIAAAQKKASKIVKDLKPRISHIALDERYQMIDEEDIKQETPERDWLKNDHVPETESNPEHMRQKDNRDKKE